MFMTGKRSKTLLEVIPIDAVTHPPWRTINPLAFLRDFRVVLEGMTEEERRTFDPIVNPVAPLRLLNKTGGLREVQGAKGLASREIERLFIK